MRQPLGPLSRLLALVVTPALGGSIDGKLLERGTVDTRSTVAYTVQYTKGIAVAIVAGEGGGDLGGS